MRPNGARGSVKTCLYCSTHAHYNRLRVVSNFGDGDCGAGEIHTRARAKRDAKGAPKISSVASKFRARARVCIPPASPKLETTRSLHYNNTACLNLLFKLSWKENVLNIKKGNPVTNLPLSSSQSSVVSHCPSFILFTRQRFFKRVYISTLSHC